MKGLEPLMLGLKPKVLPIKLHSYITYKDRVVLMSTLTPSFYLGVYVE